MKIYYSMDSIPELAGLPRADQKKLFSQSLLRLLRSLRCWISLLVLFTVCAFLGTFLGGNLGRAIGYIVAIFIGHQILFRMQRPIVMELKKEAKKIKG
jgi:hypothetical protein